MVAAFSPIRRTTVAEEVCARLTAGIRSGELAPGSQLPSERLLCTEFGVARTSVREAIQALVTGGLVDRRANRTFVSEALPHLDLDGPADERKVRVRQLFEVRRLIETRTAELAAVRASPANREELSVLSKRFSGTMHLDEFRALDREFHTLVARTASNPILAEVALKVLEALFTSTDFDSLLFAQSNAGVVARIVSESGQAHRSIAKAIGAGDSAAAAAAASAHLDQVEERMLRQLQ